MKTPREILSERHRIMMPKLDAVRAGILRNELGGEKPPAHPAAHPAAHPGWGAILANLPRLFWRELIFPCRRAWVGLGVAWVLIEATHFALRGHSTVVMAGLSSAPATLVTWRQQERIVNEWMGWNEMPADRPPKSFSPQPSSWRRMEILMT